MVLLTALTLPALTPYVHSFLGGQGVVTVEDFVLHDLQNLLAIAEDDLLSIELKQAVTDLLTYLESIQESWSSGVDLFQQDRQFLPFNCESVDLLLEGGLLEGTVTELVGASSTGKSQMCMQAAASVAHRYPTAVVAYIDSGRTFSAQRVAHILTGFLDSQTEAVDQPNDLASAMKNIRRIGVFDIYSMMSFLSTLLGCPESKSHQLADDISHLRLLIIDSVSAVIAPVLGGTQPRGHALMVNVGQSLKRIAAANGLAVLITNHTVTGDEGHVKPALGESWLSVPHVRLWLHRDLDSDVCEISLIKHTSLPFGNQARFHIGTTGLVSIDDGPKSPDASLTDPRLLIEYK